ncbi:MAG: hypothetical protein OHK93_004092 [Ramalina farinacea]|uniref:FAD dependent oxidoreductase domain-containing protein n=1 Tax=Ramalina farinacea TaxID=258253 RepID=A0AA43QJM8_9LECA|nr:hypothetical protein [Ramalina farinacea]
MGFQAVGANVSRSNHLVSLDLADYGQKRTTVRLDNLVLAAGPWTPALFQMLFPASSIDLEPVTDASDWIVFENPKPMSAKTIGAVYLDDIVGEKLEFAGRNDHTIWATGKRSHAGVVPTVGRTPEVDQASLDELHADAEVFLKHGQGEDRELHVLSQGRSYRPTTQTGMPIIAGVPADRLSVNSSIWPLETTKKSVYVNFGHGSHGILLGMGSGKLMSQIIRGEKTDINVSKMGFS